MNGLKRRVTQKDIAKETGYAINTVSKALRNASDLADETKRQIQEVADKMGYIINTSANSLRSGHTHTIALIVADIANPLFAIIAKEMETVARRMEYTIFVMNTEESAEREEMAIRAAIEKNVDGVLLFQTQLNRAAVDKLENVGTPCILIHRMSAGQELDAVLIDEELGGYLAAKRLIDRGRKRIAMLNAPTYISSSLKRQMGFMRALSEAGLADFSKIIYLENALGGCEASIKKAFNVGETPDGLFCFSDMLAFEAIDTLREMGLKVPEDISVIGFDNIQSGLSIPFPLTTISTHKSDLAKNAVSVLLRRINGDYVDFPARITLPVSLIERGSV